MVRFLTEDDRSMFDIFLRWLQRNYGILGIYAKSDNANLLSIGREISVWMTTNGFADDTFSEDGRYYLNINGYLLLSAVEQEQYDSSVDDGILLGKPTGIELLDEVINSSTEYIDALKVVYLRSIYKILVESIEEEIHDILLALADDALFTTISQLAHSIIISREEGI